MAWFLNSYYIISLLIKKLKTYISQLNCFAFSQRKLFWIFYNSLTFNPHRLPPSGVFYGAAKRTRRPYDLELKLFFRVVFPFQYI